MSSDLESITAVVSAARRRLENGELVFAVKDALRVIQSCNAYEIAVLRVEDFPGLNVSTYDLRVGSPGHGELWPEFVRRNNSLAEEFIQRQKAVNRESDCVLTTSSWLEFRRESQDK